MAELHLCNTRGNPDLYGLGIRLGIYFQLIATFISSRLLPEEVVTVWDTNSIFILAVFAAVASATTDQSVQYVEIFVMLQLMFAFLIAVDYKDSRVIWYLLSSVTILKKRDEDILIKHLTSSRVGRSWRTALSTAIACYNIWFWFAFKPPQLCQSYIFLLAKASPSPVSQQVYRILAVLYMLRRALHYLGEILVFVLDFSRKMKTWSKTKPQGMKRMCSQSLMTFALDIYYKQGQRGRSRTLVEIERIQNHQYVIFT